MLLLLGAALAAMPAQAQTKWTQPTDEELKMTAQPQVPGAPAVYLYREEMTDDLLHERSVYVRLKILTEAGKALGDVRLTYLSDLAVDDPDISDLTADVTDIAGRTIHSDGTIIPFTGQPFERTVEKSTGAKFSEKVFSLPQVEVGSILEYRFKLRIGDNEYETPQWLVQQRLYVRKAYYYWKASDIFTEGSSTRGLAWSNVLPPGAVVKSSAVPGTGNTHPYHLIELAVHDIPPMQHEAFMPPMRSLSYRVNFYRAAYRTQDEFWRERGKAWVKQMEHFIGPAQGMTAQVQTLVAPGDSDMVKLQKIYAAIMEMDNTMFSRKHSESENKAHGLGKAHTAQDIWDRKRGRPEEMTALFVALARSAGMRAYLMAVTDRDTDIFSPAWLSLEQLNGFVAIVVVDGKEQFFDPGQRYCPFGQMAWKHTGAGGLREIEGGGSALANTPEPPYIQSQTQRTADLTMEDDGTVHGTVKITLIGAPALSWRHLGLRRDETAVRNTMRSWIRARLPEGIEVKNGTIENLADYEKPLVATYDVRGMLATVSAKRLMLPGQLFESRTKPLFPQETRDVPIYFNHGGRTIDAVRVKFPEDVTLESAPKDDQVALQRLASYRIKAETQPGSVLLRRTYDLGSPFFTVAEYPEVKTFFSKMATDDQQPVVLLRPAEAAGSQ
jgi:hypothetical protein